MPLTVEEVTKRIDNFLQHTPPQRGILQPVRKVTLKQFETYWRENRGEFAPSFHPRRDGIPEGWVPPVGDDSSEPNQLEHDLINKELQKVIFSDQKECLESIAKLPVTLAIEAQKLRLLRIGAEIDLANVKYSGINSDCFNELLNALEFGNISENLKHKFAYVSLAYYLSYVEEDVTKQQALLFFTNTKNFLQQGNIPHFLAIDFEFLKLYYSFSMLLRSLAPRDTLVHKVYGDLPLEVRLEDKNFAIRINSLVSGLMPRIDWIDLQDKIAILTAYSMISKISYERDQFCDPVQLKKVVDFVTDSINKNMDLVAKEAARKDKLQANKAHIAELQERLKQIEAWGEAETARINAYWNAVLQQQISNINSSIAQAKRDAHSRAFGNTLKQSIGIAAGCFVGPAACGALGLAAGAPTTLITSAAIGGATQAAITGGNLGDVLKSATVAGVTAGVMSKVPVAGDLTGAAQRIEGAKLGVLNSAVSTGASIIVRGEGKLDPATMLGAGLARATGVGMDDGLTKDLTERAIKDTTATAIHGGKLVPILASGAIESAAGHFGKTKGEELKTKIEAERVRSQLVLQQQSQHEEPTPLQESSEQEREARRKAKGKDRVKDDEAKQKVLDETKRRQERNLRWLEQTDLFGNHWSSEVEAQPILLQEQKEQLKLKILTDLKMRAYLQANLQGVDFELNKIASLIIKRIDAMDKQSLTKLDKEYDFYQLQPQEFRQFKVVDAVFENSGCSEEAKNPLELSQTPQKSFWQRFKENYVATILEQDQEETTLCRAQAEETLRLLQKYRVGTRAVGALEIFAGSAQTGAVSSPKLRADTSRRFLATTNPSALDQAQFLPGKFISNNDLAISSKQQQQLQSNSSWMNSILSFPGDLLFGQMAHADGEPQSSDGASSSSATKQQFYSNLEANWFEKCVIGSGRGTVALGQKIEMAGIWSAEKLGFVGSGVRENYIRRISVEKELYDSTPVGQSTLGKTAEFTANLFFGYVGARTGIGTLKTAGDIIYSKYTAGKAFKGADGGGKYAGELRSYRINQTIPELRKTILSHQKSIAKHKEYIKNPKLKYDNWETMKPKHKNNAIHHWQEDIKRAKIYEELAKRVLNEQLSNSSEFPQTPKP